MTGDTLMTDVGVLFEQNDWSYLAVEAGVWRTTFAVASDEEFDLYVVLAEDWLHFAVSPFLTTGALTSPARLQRTLLKLNHELRMARFALDADGDVNLLADLPLDSADAAHFGQMLDLLVFYADRLAADLRRVAEDPNFHSALVAD
jgi:hypothetical protein